MNLTGKRIGSLLLTVCMVFTMLPTVAFAEAGVTDSGAPLGISGEITAFAELDANVAEQTKEAGTEESELTLPGTLTVTVTTGSAITATGSDAQELEELEEEIETTVTMAVYGWTSDPAYDGDEGVYTFTPALVLPDGITIAEGVTLPQITVTINAPAAPTQFGSFGSFGTTAVDIAINDTNFPDDNFRAWLLDQHYGDDDDVLTPAEIDAITFIHVYDQDISDLTGIEYFTALTVLLCDNNELTALPALLPTGLTTLDCNTNSLTALPALPDGLTELNCSQNNLTALPALPDGLTELDCSVNNLTALPALPAGLTGLYCYNNNLTELTLNSSATYVAISANGNYMTNTSDVTGPTINWLSADGGSGNAAFLFYPQKTVPGGDIIINAANFPDANFRAWLTNGANIGGAGSDNILTAAEIAAITSMDVSSQNISNLTGIGYFTALTALYCEQNNLTALPTLPAGLISLDFSQNNLTALPVSLPANLTALDCEQNNLTALPTLPASLRDLLCSNNSLTTLPALPAGLTTLSCNGNNLTALPTLPVGLTTLYCSYNSLTVLPTLPVGLAYLRCKNNNLTALPELPNSLIWINCTVNNLTDLPALPSGLTELNCSYNSLTALALNDSATYAYIDVSYNNIESTDDVTGNSIPWDDVDFIFNPQRTPVTFTATQTGGTSGTANSTGITLTFSEAVDYLTAEKITITSGTGSAVKGALSGSGTTWTLALAGVTTQGNVTVSVADFSTFHATNNPQTVAVYKASGGGGGGGGSSVVTPPAEQPKTETTTSGNTATATTTATAAVNSSGTATAADTQAQVSDAITKAAEAAAKQGGGTAAVVEIKVTAPADAKTVETSIPKAAMELIADGKTAALTVSTPVASLSFDAAALSTIAGKAAGDVNISASIVDASTLSAETQQLIGDRPVFNFSVTGGGQTISQFGGSVSVSVPYTPKAGEDLNAIVIYYINAEGKPEVVSNCSYDPATGTIRFKTDHFSQYAVGYNKVTFKDVAESAWYSKAVGFIAARGVTTGTGNGNYSPDAKLTRGEFIVMMMKAYGIAPDTATAENFADAGNTYYTGYLAAAKRLGISGGVGNNMFAPGKEITRQEMFTLLYNALKAIGELPEGNTGKSLSAFSDAGQVASWAKDAMTLLVKTGTVSGTNGKLTPEETTTRAQMAQVLYNLLSQ